MPDTTPDGFTDLARAGRKNRGTALLRAATELFALDGDHDVEQIRRFEELTVHLLPDAPLEDRITTAEKLAGIADAPTSVLTMLAKDELAVATPILARSPALGSFELLCIIAATGREHHAIIAERANLPDDVRRALDIAVGTSESAPSPARAEDAALEAKAGPQAIRAVQDLMEESGQATGNMTEAQENLTEPPPVPDAGPVAATITSRFGNAWEFMRSPRDARLRRLADIASSPPYEGLNADLPEDALGQLANTANLIGLARSQKTEDLIAAMAWALRLPSEIVAAAMNDDTGEPLAVLMKAMRLDDVTAQQVFLLMTPLGLDATRFYAVTDLYSSLEGYVCDTLASAWRGEIVDTPDQGIESEGASPRSEHIDPSHEDAQHAPRRTFGRRIA